MASVGTYSCLIVFFFFSEIVMLSPVLAARNMGEASLLPPLPSSTHNFLEQCAAKLPVECGVEIVGTLFGDGTLTASCCSNLVAIGRPCHDEFLAVTLPFHKEVDPSIVLANSEKLGLIVLINYRRTKPSQHSPLQQYMPTWRSIICRFN
ncbi:hypothetical protein ACOSQ4_004446 [Xanthoceras sorbifolium]